MTASVIEECASALAGTPWLLVFTHALAFLAGVGTYALYRRARGERL